MAQPAGLACTQCASSAGHVWRFDAFDSATSYLSKCPTGKATCVDALAQQSGTETSVSGPEAGTTGQDAACQVIVRSPGGGVCADPGWARSVACAPGYKVWGLSDTPECSASTEGDETLHGWGLAAACVGACGTGIVTGEVAADTLAFPLAVTGIPEIVGPIMGCGTGAFVTFFAKRPTALVEWMDATNTAMGG